MSYKENRRVLILLFLASQAYITITIVMLCLIDVSKFSTIFAVQKFENLFLIYTVNIHSDNCFALSDSAV